MATDPFWEKHFDINTATHPHLENIGKLLALEKEKPMAPKKSVTLFIIKYIGTEMVLKGEDCRFVKFDNEWRKGESLDNRDWNYTFSGRQSASLVYLAESNHFIKNRMHKDRWQVVKAGVEVDGKRERFGPPKPNVITDEGDDFGND